MASYQYMRPDGMWLCSCQEGTPPPEGAILALADADGFRGADGLQWDGKGWAVYAPPPDACTRFQGLRALGRVRVEQIETVMAGLDKLEIYPGVTLSADEVWSIRTAWKEAGTFERLSPDLAFVMWMFGWGDEMRDDFFRWIGDGQTGVFPG